MRIWVFVISLGWVAFAGCKHQQPGVMSQGAFSPLPISSSPPLLASAPDAQALPVSRQKLIVTPETGLSGKVVKVNTSGRFVVLNFPIGHLPALDQRLVVYHQGLKVADVKISGPQLDDNIVGDLVAGTAEVGDDVREQ